MNPLRGSVIGLAGLVGAGLLAWPVVADDNAPDGVTKRDEQETELVTVEDDDDTRDKTRDNSRDRDARVDITRGVDNTRSDDDTRGDNNTRDRDATRGDNSTRDREATRGENSTRDRGDNNTRDRDTN